MYCRLCDIEYPKSLRFCKWCGGGLVEKDAARPQHCPACGSSVEREWVFCNECGVDLATLGAQPRDQTCPACSASVRKGWMFCRQCGEQIANERASQRCQACGAGVREGWQFCKQCGAALGPEAEAGPPFMTLAGIPVLPAEDDSDEPFSGLNSGELPPLDDVIATDRRAKQAGRRRGLTTNKGREVQPSGGTHPLKSGRSTGSLEDDVLEREPQSGWEAPNPANMTISMGAQFGDAGPQQASSPPASPEPLAAPRAPEPPPAVDGGTLNISAPGAASAAAQPQGGSTLDNTSVFAGSFPPVMPSAHAPGMPNAQAVEQDLRTLPIREVPELAQQVSDSTQAFVPPFAPQTSDSTQAFVPPFAPQTSDSTQAFVAPPAPQASDSTQAFVAPAAMPPSPPVAGPPAQSPVQSSPLQDLRTHLIASQMRESGQRTQAPMSAPPPVPYQNTVDLMPPPVALPMSAPPPVPRQNTADLMPPPVGMPASAPQPIPHQSTVDLMPPPIAVPVSAPPKPQAPPWPSAPPAETQAAAQPGGSGLKWIAIGLVVLALAGASIVVAILIWQRFNQPTQIVETPPPPVVETPTQPGPAPPVEQPATPQPPEGMVYVPGGKLQMGSNDADADVYSKPAHPVDVKPFFIDKTEVTNGDYKLFVDATKHAAPANWDGASPKPGTERLPVVLVSWNDARDYAAWAKKRLPTEAEWEFAARGTDGRSYPWGPTWDTSYGNIGKDKDTGQVMPVGSFPNGASPYGALDMVGNVWEWTASSFSLYPGGTAPDAAQFAGRKVIRGGAYDALKIHTAMYRGFFAPTETLVKTGFRCARDIP